MEKESEKTDKRTKGGESRSEAAKTNPSEGAHGKKQMHEDREHPERDHVPGHMGYDRSNIDTVITTPRKGPTPKGQGE